jgi:hypothetical protein
MQLKPVTSAALKSVGYDAAARELHIEFHSGKVYTYPDVTPEAHSALMAADSHGEHFAEHVRPLAGVLQGAAE